MQNKISKITSKYNQGVILQNAGRLDEAEQMYQDAISDDPLLTLAQLNLLSQINLGVIMIARGQFTQAIDHYNGLIGKFFNHPAIFNNMGVAYARLEKLDLAQGYLNHALSLDPGFEQALYTLATVFSKKGDYTQALAQLNKALEKNPNYDKAHHLLYHTLRYLCLWREARQAGIKLNQIINDELKRGEKSIEPPFLNIVRVADPKINYHVAKSWGQFIDHTMAKAKQELRFKFSQEPSPRQIKIGYLSNGFRDFPTSHNLIGVLENHDRRQFHVTAFSFGASDETNWRQRISQAVDHLSDLSSLSFVEAAKKIHEEKIDILIDLKGHTEANKLEIFALRPAPVQISYLGFPGTTGAPFIDYLIADQIVIPPSQKKFYSERIIYLPFSYRPADAHPHVSSAKYSRRDFGLPATAIVFSSFNMPYKIEEEVFLAWMKILKAVPKSVLWLFSTNSDTNTNLHAQAKDLGILPDRIIFATRLPKEFHLARVGLGDIALDTPPVNGHTTTVDCLWAGVPVITTEGSHFASRVSQSVLTAVGLSELVTPNLKDYAKLATDLATHPQKLRRLKIKLQKNIKTKPLFDTRTYTRDLEKAYSTIWSINVNQSRLLQ